MWQQNKDQAVQLGKLSHSETELMETNKRLRETVDRVREELRASQGQAEKGRQEAERCALVRLARTLFFLFFFSKEKSFQVFCVFTRLLEDQQLRWLEDKQELQKQAAELQQKFSQAKEKLQRAAAAQKKVGSITPTSTFPVSTWEVRVSAGSPDVTAGQSYLFYVDYIYTLLDVVILVEHI